MRRRTGKKKAHAKQALLGGDSSTALAAAGEQASVTVGLPSTRTVPPQPTLDPTAWGWPPPSTAKPTKGPIGPPTNTPTLVPTHDPSPFPTFLPSSPVNISPVPTLGPTNPPTLWPTLDPTTVPTMAPSTDEPTFKPTGVPSLNPTLLPTGDGKHPAAAEIRKAIQGKVDLGVLRRAVGKTIKAFNGNISKSIGKFEVRSGTTERRKAHRTKALPPEGSADVLRKQNPPPGKASAKLQHQKAHNAKLFPLEGSADVFRSANAYYTQSPPPEIASTALHRRNAYNAQLFSPGASPDDFRPPVAYYTQSTPPDDQKPASMATAFAKAYHALWS